MSGLGREQTEERGREKETSEGRWEAWRERVGEREEPPSLA